MAYTDGNWERKRELKRKGGNSEIYYLPVHTCNYSYEAKVIKSLENATLHNIIKRVSRIYGGKMNIYHVLSACSGPGAFHTLSLILKSSIALLSASYLFSSPIPSSAIFILFFLSSIVSFISITILGTTNISTLFLFMISCFLHSNTLSPSIPLF